MCIQVFKKQIEKLQWIGYKIPVLQYFLKPKEAFANVLQAIMNMKQI